MTYFGSPSREKGFTLAADIFRKNKGKLIVETGCLWEPSQGQSTIFFAELAKETGAKFVSLDSNPEHCTFARKAAPNAAVICADSLNYLSSPFTPPHDLTVIDLLYLDSFDWDSSKPNIHSIYNVAELGACLGKMAKHSCILLDDWNGGSGDWLKCPLSRELLLYRGWKLVNEDYQLLFER